MATASPRSGHEHPTVTGTLRGAPRNAGAGSWTSISDNTHTTPGRRDAVVERHQDRPIRRPTANTATPRPRRSRDDVTYKSRRPIGCQAEPRAALRSCGRPSQVRGRDHRCRMWPRPPGSVCSGSRGSESRRHARPPPRSPTTVAALREGFQPRQRGPHTWCRSPSRRTGSPRHRLKSLQVSARRCDPPPATGRPERHRFAGPQSSYELGAVAHGTSSSGRRRSGRHNRRAARPVEH